MNRFHYGNPSDYDEWARLGGEGAEAWAYKDFHKYVLSYFPTMQTGVLMWQSRYFLRFEKFVPNKSHPVVEGEHGFDGPIEGINI